MTQNEKLVYESFGIKFGIGLQVLHKISSGYCLEKGLSNWIKYWDNEVKVWLSNWIKFLFKGCVPLSKWIQEKKKCCYTNEIEKKHIEDNRRPKKKSMDWGVTLNFKS